MAFLFSCAVGATKSTHRVHSTVPYFTCILSIAELVTGMVIAWISGSSPVFGARKNMPWLILVGLIYGGIVTLLYAPLALIPAVDDIALLYSNPILATIIGTVVFRDRFRITSGIGLCVYFIGVLFLVKPRFLCGAGNVVWAYRRKVGYGLAMLASILSAITVNLIRGL